MQELNNEKLNALSYQQSKECWLLFLATRGHYRAGDENPSRHDQKPIPTASWQGAICRICYEPVVVGYDESHHLEPSRDGHEVEVLRGGL